MATQCWPVLWAPFSCTIISFTSPLGGLRGTWGLTWPWVLPLHCFPANPSHLGGHQLASLSSRNFFNSAFFFFFFTHSAHQQAKRIPSPDEPPTISSPAWMSPPLMVSHPGLQQQPLLWPATVNHSKPRPFAEGLQPTPHDPNRKNANSHRGSHCPNKPSSACSSRHWPLVATQSLSSSVQPFSFWIQLPISSGWLTLTWWELNDSLCWREYKLAPHFRKTSC